MATIGACGVFKGTDKEGRLWTIPRHIDPGLDGTKLAVHHPQSFSVADAPNSISLQDFDARIEARVPIEVISRIERTIEAGKALALKCLADTPPLDEKEWRRGMILAWSHSRDLAVVHDALGHPRSVLHHEITYR